MNRQVFKQFFASWKSSIWIVLELSVLFVVLSMTMRTPLYYMYIQVSNSRGHLLRNDVIVIPSDEVTAGELASLPEVEYCQTVQNGMFPSGRFFRATMIGRDSASMVQCFMLWRPENKEVSDMIGYEYVYPAEGPDWERYGDNSMIISADLARHFYGTPEEAVGKVLKVGGDFNASLEISAVIKPMKCISQGNPNSTILLPACINQEEMSGSSSYHLLSLNQGADPDEFVMNINREFGCKADTYRSTVKWSENMLGIKDPNYIMAIIIGFAVLNIILCSLSFSYLRVKVRMDELGVRLACGASHRSIMWLFVKEGLLMSAIASLIGIVINLNLITPGTYSNTGFCIPELAAYFPLVMNYDLFLAIVYLITALLLAVIAVAASLIAVSGVSRISVSEAFREE